MWDITEAEGKLLDCRIKTLSESLTRSLIGGAIIQDSILLPPTIPSVYLKFKVS